MSMVYFVCDCLNMKNESKIVAGILSNDEPSLRAFYESHVSHITNFVRQRVSGEADVEEIVQDTFLATLEALRDFTFACTLSTFMCSIAKRKVIDYYRKQSIRRMVLSKSSSLESVLSILADPEKKLDNALLKDQIDIAFSKIKPLHQRILRMKYVEGRSVSEMATELAMSFKSVESMLFRARKAFVLAYDK